MIHSKHFSLSQARTLLPGINTKLEKIIQFTEILNERGYDIYTHQYFGGIGSNGTGKYPVELENLIKNINEITLEGIVVKGIENGLIDFPHIRENGEEVYLCYMYGENDIAYWHSIKDGFAGRKSVEDL